MAIANTSGWIDLPMVGLALKPLTTLLIGLYAMQLPSTDPYRRRWVLAALSFSFLGECAMAFPEGLLPGTYLFVLAQSAYLAAMTGSGLKLARPGPMHLVHAVAVAWALAMWSVRSITVFVPMVLLFSLLGLVSAQADAWWWRARGTPEADAARSAAVGALLWILADLTMTYSSFVEWIPETFAIVLTLYWLAQWHLIALIGTPAATSTRSS